MNSTIPKKKFRSPIISLSYPDAILEAVLKLAQLMLQIVLCIHQWPGALLDAVLHALQRPSLILAATGSTAVHCGLGDIILTRSS